MKRKSLSQKREVSFNILLLLEKKKAEKELKQVALDIKKLNDEKKKRPMKKSQQLIGNQVSLITSTNNYQRSEHATKRPTWMNNYEATKIN